MRTTCLKIESKLTHPALPAFPVLAGKPPPLGCLHPIMKCKLLPLCIPLIGMRQLPCKLESEGLLIVFSQTKAVSKQSRAASDWWLFGLSGLGKRETTAAAAPAAVSPGWSASRLSPGALLWSFSLFSLSEVTVCMCVYVRPCVGPQAIVRQIMGADVS